MRKEFLDGTDERAGTDFESFAGWLATKDRWHSWWTIEFLEPGVIADSLTMTIHNNSLFDLEAHISTGQEKIRKVWIMRLPNIVAQLNAHPLTEGLPDIELITYEAGGFVIKFVE
jgi:hypothetical protein